MKRHMRAGLFDALMDRPREARYKSLFSPKTPAVEPLPPLPTREDPSVKAARDREKLEAGRRKGRRATVLTSGQGVTDEGTLGRPRLTGDRSATLLG